MSTALPAMTEQPFDSERRWIKNYPEGVPASLEYPDIPAWKLLRHTSEDFPERIAWKCSGRMATYAQLWRRTELIAGVLKKFGVEPGDRVGILLPNIPEYLSSLNAIWMVGGIAVAINPLMVEDEVQSLLKTTQCKLVIALDMLAPLVLDGENCPDKVLVVTLSDRLPRWQQLGYVFARRQKTGRWWVDTEHHVHWLEDEINRPDVPIVRPAEIDPATTPAYILPTGGTTGHPKAVVLSHRNLVANAWQQFHWILREQSQHTFLAVLPFFHCYGLSAILMTGVTMGATLLIHYRFNVRKTVQLIEEHCPTVFHSVPAMLVALSERVEKYPGDLTSIQYVISGGATLDKAIAEEFIFHSGAECVEGYGLSEASPVTHVGPLDGTARRGSIGMPLPDTNAKIVDPEDGSKELGIGVVGELIVHGPQIMMGYYNLPEETAKVVKDGWLYTGDLAYQDEDGFFHIVDRKKDLIITSGFNVVPAEVEEVIRRHPGVKDVAVIGVPDKQRGQLVKALVVMNPGHKFNNEDLDEFCRKNIQASKRPREFEVVQGDLPRNFLGKVLRRHLRDPDTQPDIDYDKGTAQELANEIHKTERANLKDDPFDVPDEEKEP